MPSPSKVIDDSFDDNSEKKSVKAKGPAGADTRVVSFAYRPQPRAMTETFGTRHGTHIPNPPMMQNAFLAACHIREKNLPKLVQDAYHAGVDLATVQSSAELSQAAQSGQVVLENCFFDDFLTAEYYRGALRPDKHGLDSTVPLTTAAQKAHVQLLVKAFNNYQNCDDNTQMIRPFAERRHDSKLVEVLCWGILKSCIMRSNSDEPLLTAYEPAKSRNSPGVNTFAERFDEIIKSMARSKTICKHLYDPPYVNVFVDDPVRAVRRVDANRDLNRQKGQIMGKGKKLLEEEEKAKGTTPEPRGRKRRAVAFENEAGSPRNDCKPVRRSLIVNLPVGRDQSSYPAVQGTTRAIGDLGEAPSTPISTGFATPYSPKFEPRVKQEGLSPHRVPPTFTMPPARPGYGLSNAARTPTYGSFQPFQTYSYGGGPSSSYNPYGSNMYSAGLGGMNDYFNVNQLHQRQAEYAANQPGFAYGPLHGRITASAPTTPSVPGFPSGGLINNAANSPPTPSSCGFAIPEEITPAGDDGEQTAEADLLDDGVEASGDI